jgi:hypothetical protein
MVSVKSCCCGCSLSRGTLIIGIVGIVFAAISLFMGFADACAHGPLCSLWHGRMDAWMGGCMDAWTLFIAGLVGLAANALLICGVK